MPNASVPVASRRRLLRCSLTGAAVIALPTFWSRARAATSAPLLLTPSQTEGPFYPVALPADIDFDLLRTGAQAYTRGEPAWLGGSVRDAEGRPVRGAQVEIWQCDEGGHYHHPADGGRADPAFQGFGRVSVDGDGRYRFRTLRPVPYGGRTPHIHVKVRLGGRELLTTQVYVQGEPRNARDFLWRRLDGDTERAALTVPFVPAEGGLRAEFAIVVAA